MSKPAISVRTPRIAAVALAVAVFALSYAPAVAQTCKGARTASTTRLTVEATGVHSSSGDVTFTVYPDDRRRFLAKGGKLAKVRVPARPITVACFWLPPGSYAIAQYHDENGDGHFNRTLFTPKEGFGFSNDAPTTLGLPSLSAVRFNLPAAGRTMPMKMRYRR